MSALLLGILALFWLPIEDSGELVPQLLALAAGAWLFVRGEVRTPTPCQHPIRRPAFTAAGVGLGLAPLATILMVFKSGLHGHGFPDYEPWQFSSVLGRAPIWLMAWLAVGLSVGLWRRARCP